MDTEESPSSHSGELPTETTPPAVADIPTAVDIPAYIAPAEEPAPAVPPAQPVPQVYPQFDAVSSEAAPVFLPPATGNLSQPGHPAIASASGGLEPLPGQFQPLAPMAAPTPKKRGRLALWILLIIAVLLLLGVSNTATFALTRPATSAPQQAATQHLPTPNGTLQTYCQAIMAENAETIFNLLSAQAKVHTSLDDLQRSFDMFNLASAGGTMKAQFTNCTFDNVRVSGQLAVATVSPTLSLTIQNPEQKQPQTITETSPSLTSLVWESNQWKIDFSSLAQPMPAFAVSGVALPTVTP